jgi:hypothetical protein
MERHGRFLAGFALGTLSLAAAFLVALTVLAGTDRLKAPAFANRASFDEKLRQLRQAGLRDAEVLLLGSSTTLHGVDGEVLERVLMGAPQPGPEAPRVINVGVQDMKMHQADFLAAFYLDQFPSVRDVVTISTMLDYEHCPSTDRAFFDPLQAAAYLQGHRSETYMHFKYLDPEAVLRRARNIRERRVARDILDSLAFDRHGGLLLDVPRERLDPLVYQGAPIVLDPPCYQALASLARRLEAHGVAFTFVLAPMRPGYLALRDPDGRLLAEHRRRLEAALSASTALVVDAHDRMGLPDPAFFDAYHVLPHEAARLTELIARAMRGLPEIGDEVEGRPGGPLPSPSLGG